MKKIITAVGLLISLMLTSNRAWATGSSTESEKPCQAIYDKLMSTGPCPSGETCTTFSVQISNLTAGASSVCTLHGNATFDSEVLTRDMSFQGAKGTPPVYTPLSSIGEQYSFGAYQLTLSEALANPPIEFIGFDNFALFYTKQVPHGNMTILRDYWVTTHNRIVFKPVDCDEGACVVQTGDGGSAAGNVVGQSDTNNNNGEGAGPPSLGIGNQTGAVNQNVGRTSSEDGGPFSCALNPNFGFDSGALNCSWIVLSVIALATVRRKKI